MRNLLIEFALALVILALIVPGVIWWAKTILAAVQGMLP